MANEYAFSWKRTVAVSTVIAAGLAALFNVAEYQNTRRLLASGRTPAEARAALQPDNVFGGISSYVTWPGREAALNGRMQIVYAGMKSVK